MVQKGQYLERPVLIATGAICLEGLFHRGERAPAALILPPHPKLGGSMDSPVVAELAWALTRAGHPTLRLNYRGVGASQGAWEDGQHDVGDLRMALQLLAASASASTDDAPAPVALVGYSYGADLVLRALVDGVHAAAVVLVAPPVTLLDPSEHLAGLPSDFAPSDRVFTFCGSEDSVAVPEEVESIFGLHLGERHRADTIAGADHVFREGLVTLGQQVVKVLER